MQITSKSLAEVFHPVFKAFADGMMHNTRTATRNFFDFSEASPSIHVEQRAEGVFKVLTVALLDGSGYTIEMGQFNNGSIGYSFGLIGASVEAMSALLDVAAAGFTEMDSQSLAAGISQ